MQVLRYELYKLCKGKIVKVAVVLFITVAMLLAIGELHADLEPFQRSGMLAIAVLANTYPIIVIFCGIFAGLFVATDIKRAVTDHALCGGASKKTVYFSKLFCVILMFSLILAVVVAMLLITGTVRFGWNPENIVYDRYALKLAVFYLVFWVHSVAYAAVFTMVAFTTKKVALTAGICAAFMLVELQIVSIALVSPGHALVFISSFLPGNIIRTVFNELIVARDLILTWTFISGVIPSLIIFAVFTTVGLFVFNRRS